MITVTAKAKRVTPPKNEAAPINEKTPGSIQAQYPKSSLWTPNM